MPEHIQAFAGSKVARQWLPNDPICKGLTTSEGVNESLMTALTVNNHPLCVAYAGRANARHSPSYACALRLDRAAFDGPFGHDGFIHTFSVFTNATLQVACIDSPGSHDKSQ